MSKILWTSDMRTHADIEDPDHHDGGELATGHVTEVVHDWH